MTKQRNQEIMVSEDQYIMIQRYQQINIYQKSNIYVLSRKNIYLNTTERDKDFSSETLDYAVCERFRDF